MSQPIIYINGTYYDKADAKLSVLDSGLLYGDGVFEGIPCYQGMPWLLIEHLDRLWSSAHAISLTPPLSKRDLADVIAETLRRNNADDSYLRVILTRGGGISPGLDPIYERRPTVIVIAEPLQLYPSHVYTQGMKLVTSSIIRNADAALSPRIKSLNYLNNILAKIEGFSSGCHEVLMLNLHGYVAECTADNIFVVKNRVLMTPSKTEGILEGITRGAILQLAAEIPVETFECRLTKYDVYDADECFITGSAAGIVPIIELDGRKIGDGSPGELTKKLIAMYAELVARAVQTKRSLSGTA